MSFLSQKYFINMFMFTPGQTSTATLSIYRALLHEFQKQKKGYNSEQKLCVGMEHSFLMHALISFTKLWIFLGLFSNAAWSACAWTAAWYMLLVMGHVTDRLLLVRNVYIARLPAVPLPSPTSMNVMARPTNISPLFLLSLAIVLVAIQNNQRKPEIGVISDLTVILTSSLRGENMIVSFFSPTYQTFSKSILPLSGPPQ